MESYGNGCGKVEVVCCAPKKSIVSSTLLIRIIYNILSKSLDLSGFKQMGLHLDFD